MLEILSQHLRQHFGFPENALYCQVANHSSLKPRLRTMRLYAITPEGELEFLTHTETQKWLAWQKEASVALCFFKEHFGQILVEGKVHLKTTLSHPQHAQRYWDTLPKPVKNIYGSTTNAPACFGIISVIPELFEILALSFEDYLSSCRMLYTLKNHLWACQKIAITS